MRALALDLALTTGYAHNCGPTLCSGVEHFHTAKKADPALRLRDFRRWLTDLLDTTQPELVAYEAPINEHRSRAQRDLSIALASRVQEEAAARGIPYVPVYSSSLKKQATGNGKATKDEMVAAAKREWPEVAAWLTDDNESDALCLLAAVLKGLPAPTGGARRKKARQTRQDGQQAPSRVGCGQSASESAAGVESSPSLSTPAREGNTPGKGGRRVER